VLHRKDCSYLTGPIDRGERLTAYPKHCSTSVDELRSRMHAYPGAKTCSRCHP
jgi:hypothetical protein